MLKNTGTKPIDTQVYNHDFFVIDHEVVGPDMVVKFAFRPSRISLLKMEEKFQATKFIIKRSCRPARPSRPI